MIEKTIKYHDLRGNEVEDTFYFNLTKAEAMGLGFEDFEGMKFSEVLLSLQETEDPGWCSLSSRPFCVRQSV